MKKQHAWIIGLGVLVFVGVVFYATRLGDDDEITRQVVDAILSHPAVDASDVRIMFERGVVTMTGQFPDPESQRIANEEARKVRGVERVVDKTVVAAEDGDPPAATP